MTLGIGSLGMAGIMAELWKPILPVWCALGIALFPFTVFVMIQPDDYSARVVRSAQRTAAVWYLATTLVLLAALLIGGKLPLGWIIYEVFVLIGSIPCCMVLFGNRTK